MQTDATLSAQPLRGGTAVRLPQETGGFLWHYGPQAFIDMFMSNRMIVKRAWPIVTHTFLPILRLASKTPAQIDRDWEAMKARRETVRFLDSPRERWRKHYGNFVREAEWALLELRKYFNQAEYEEIVVGTSVALAKEGSTDFLKMMNGMADTPSKPQKTSAAGPQKPKGLQKLAFDMFNPAGFLTGPAHIESFDAAAGEVTMEIPDCAWHTCAAEDSLPRPDQLPEEGCLLICKGAFEALFNGEDGGLKMEFEPHLPETSCTVRMSWKTKH